MALPYCKFAILYMPVKDRVQVGARFPPSHRGLEVSRLAVFPQCSFNERSSNGTSRSG